jgi:shikimate kinase
LRRSWRACAAGGDAEEFADGFRQRRAPWTWRGGDADAVGDHRLAMTLRLPRCRGGAVRHPQRRRGRGFVSRLLRRPGIDRRVKTDKIYLVGFMGAGKTTVARALATRLGWRMEDIDERIEAREHRTIAAIFAREGEGFFREVERQVLQDLLPVRHAVIATGGGTFVDPENRSAINRDGVSVWLDVPLNEVVERIPRDGRRPLASDRSQLEALFAKRTLAYQSAHIRVAAAGVKPQALVEQIMDRLAEA